MATEIKSPSEFYKILDSTSVVVADFTATWCGPCKMIAPTFEKLATAHAKPGKLAFVKVDVDKQQAVAQKYGVRSMPTFLVLQAGKIVQTIQGANPPALTIAVDKAIKLADAAKTTFSPGGHRLGGSALPTPGRQVGLSRSTAWDLKKIVDAMYTFVALYIVSFFSFDPYKAAEKSSFNKTAPKKMGATGAGANGGAARPVFKTLADLGGD